MMSRKPLIGINADFRNATKDAPGFAYLAEGYFDSVTDAGGVPAIFPPTRDAADIRHIAEMVDGFVMVGGADLNPNRDGFMMHPSVRCLADRREDFDRALIKQLAELRKPVFGIG
ncbi:MAG: gamma-glutamyl-gamma-aminobutyrate hydrolase family protein, partial [Pirellulales bacterium]